MVPGGVSWSGAQSSVSLGGCPGVVSGGVSGHSYVLSASFRCAMGCEPRHLTPAVKDPPAQVLSGPGPVVHGVRWASRRCTEVGGHQQGGWIRVRQGRGQFGRQTTGTSQEDGDRSCRTWTGGNGHWFRKANGFKGCMMASLIMFLMCSGQVVCTSVLRASLVDFPTRRTRPARPNRSLRRHELGSSLGRAHFGRRRRTSTAEPARHGNKGVRNAGLHHGQEQSGRLLRAGCH